MFGFFRRAPEPLGESHWQFICTHLPWIARLDRHRVQRLRELSNVFLRRIHVTPLGDLCLNENDTALLAGFCCLPLLEFGEQGLHSWSQLLVYPEAFRVPQIRADAAGVLHEGEAEVIGESWVRGPLVLSWADVQSDLKDPMPGSCVAVHEMAHKLDALDGLMDGTPLLPRAWQQQWAADFQAAYDTFRARANADQDTVIDTYASRSPHEFFAVCSEYHFTAPKLLRESMPLVADHLRRFYGEMAA